VVIRGKSKAVVVLGDAFYAAEYMRKKFEVEIFNGDAFWTKEFESYDNALSKFVDVYVVEDGVNLIRHETKSEDGEVLVWHELERVSNG
jgi:CTP:phosphocholine cytidylyltransferase-like protein